MNRVIAVIYGVAGLWFLLLASPSSVMQKSAVPRQH